MDVGIKGVKTPRKLVVEFFHSYDIPQFDDGNRQQLVLITPLVCKPSRLVRFAARLGLKKGNKSMMNAVERAYSFISGNYRPGDHVIIFIQSYAIDSDLNLKTAETLAKHLHDDTRPGDRSESQRRSGKNESTGQIPIHAVVVEVVRKMRELCEVNDKLKSRFPPGIEHIICFTYDEGNRSCATRFDMAGGMVSREISFSPDHGWELRVHCTKHFIYWQERQIPEWDKHDPVWTQVLDSSPGGAQDGLGLALTKPVGMYRHELRKYRRHEGRDGFMLVWKSYRGVDESHS